MIRFFLRASLDTLADRMRGRPSADGRIRDRRWPAHLHVNLIPEARGQGIGTRLMEAWSARMASHGVKGCYLSTVVENGPAARFFTAMGFVVLGGPSSIAGVRGPDGHRLRQQIMVRPAGL